MFTNILSSLVLLTSLAAASGLEARQNSNWEVSKFEAGCGANGRCFYRFQVEGQVPNGGPQFMASCIGDGVTRGDTTLRACSVNAGNLEGVSDVKAYIELRPRAPQRQTKMVIEVQHNSDGGHVNWYEGTQTGKYSVWQDLSRSGQFEVVPLATKSIARRGI